VRRGSDFAPPSHSRPDALPSSTAVMQALHHIVPHPGNNVRSLDYDPDTERLATCSFDKTVKLFRPEVRNRQ